MLLDPEWKIRFRVGDACPERRIWARRIAQRSLRLENGVRDRDRTGEKEALHCGTREDMLKRPVMKTVDGESGIKTKRRG